MPGFLGTPRYNKLIEMLIETRKPAGFTQAQVAEQLGNPQSFAAKYEGGERRLGVVELVDLVSISSNSPQQLIVGFVKEIVVTTPTA